MSDELKKTTEVHPLKPYIAPTLKEYGSLTEFTLSGGSGSSDFLGMQSDSGMN